jgi:transposase
MKQRKYEKEFKEKLVKEALETGNNSLVARKYNINPGVVCRWVRDSKKQPYKKMQAKALESYHSISEEPTDLGVALKQIHQLKAIVGKKELEIAVLTDLLKKTNAP